MEKKPTAIDFWYAVNNTRIVVPPRRHLETFGNTSIDYHLVSEPMDEVGKVRVREGRMIALKPQIILPSGGELELNLEGFGEQARKYLEWLRDHEDDVRILRYGYTIRNQAYSEHLLTETPDAIIDRIRRETFSDPFSAIIQGVDEPWDVSLICLFWAVTRQSVPENVRELNERHYFEMQDGIPLGLRDEIEKGFLAAATDRSLIRSLGKMLQDNGVFDQYQDRFFALVKGRNA